LREKDSSAISELQPRNQRCDLVSGLQLRNGIEIWPNGSQAALFNCDLVHTGAVEVADLLGDGITLHLGRCLLQNAAQKIQVVFIQLSIDVPGSLVRRNGVIFLPASTRILVKIDAGIGRFVH
jgi:hypothetical protein